MSRRVRKAPLSERLQNYLNPYDWALWLSEELQTSDWAKVPGSSSITLGLGLNLTFMIARSSSKPAASNDTDVFGDYTARNGTGWFSWFSALLVWVLILASTANAVYVFASVRKYRLFERKLEEIPPTPSARRVRVDDSPVVQSPMKYLAEKLSFGTAEGRAYPDEERDVVELSVWDPPPLCLRLLSLFSPAHWLIYMLFLPTHSLDSTPSVTVLKALFLAGLVTLQSYALETFFTQQASDKLILNREVLHEYDTKYVHPSINRPARDVGIQTPPRQKSDKRDSHGDTHRDMGTDPMTTSEVDLYREYTIINRGFRTNPNPVYASHYDRDNHLGLQSGSGHATRSNSVTTFTTPTAQPWASSYSSTGGPQTGTNGSSSPLGPSEQAQAGGFASIQRPRQPQSHSSRGDGGSLGVYSSALSPLRKTTSHGQIRPESAAEGVKRREGSPLKRMSLPTHDAGTANGAALNSRLKDLRYDGSSSRRQSGRY